MARSRNIKPGFFKNEDLMELPCEARLLFIGLWTLADREGRLEDRPKRIKIEIFPGDNYEVDDLLQELTNKCLIIRYEVDGHKYIAIPKFLKHQYPHVKEQASEIPAPDLHQTCTRLVPDMNHACPSESLVPSTESLVPIKELSHFFEDVWRLYPEKKGKANVSLKKKKELFQVGQAVLEKCIERYKKHVEQKRNTGFNLQYQNGATFFNSGYVDYLDENYSEPKKEMHPDPTWQPYKKQEEPKASFDPETEAQLANLYSKLGDK